MILLIIINYTQIKFKKKITIIFNQALLQIFIRLLKKMSYKYLMIFINNKFLIIKKVFYNCICYNYVKMNGKILILIN